MWGIYQLISFLTSAGNIEGRINISILCVNNLDIFNWLFFLLTEGVRRILLNSLNSWLVINIFVSIDIDCLLKTLLSLHLSFCITHSHINCHWTTKMSIYAIHNSLLNHLNALLWVGLSTKRLYVMSFSKNYITTKKYLNIDYWTEIYFKANF